MDIKTFYDTIGGSYSEAVSRLMNDALIKRFVLKFPKDPSFEELKAHLQSGATQEAFRAAHTLKGVCKNLAFAKLGDQASEITELLRADDLASSRSCFSEIEESYAAIIAAIGMIE